MEAKEKKVQFFRTHLRQLKLVWGSEEKMKANLAKQQTKPGSLKWENMPGQRSNAAEICIPFLLNCWSVPSGFPTELHAIFPFNFLNVVINWSKNK